MERKRNKTEVLGKRSYLRILGRNYRCKALLVVQSPIQSLLHKKEQHLRNSARAPKERAPGSDYFVSISSLQFDCHTRCPWNALLLNPTVKTTPVCESFISNVRFYVCNLMHSMKVKTPKHNPKRAFTPFDEGEHPLIHHGHDKPCTRATLAELPSRELQEVTFFLLNITITIYCHTHCHGSCNF